MRMDTAVWNSSSQQLQIAHVKISDLTVLVVFYTCVSLVPHSHRHMVSRQQASRIITLIKRD